MSITSSRSTTGSATLVGDRVLKALGEALSDTCKSHLVARYGGRGVRGPVHSAST